jgi:hypothetical protein
MHALVMYLLLHTVRFTVGTCAAISAELAFVQLSVFGALLVMRKRVRARSHANDKLWQTSRNHTAGAVVCGNHQMAIV